MSELMRFNPSLLYSLANSPTNKGNFSYINIPFFWTENQITEQQTDVATAMQEIFESVPCVYPYWLQTKNGVLLIAAFPNPAHAERRDRKSVISGLDQLSENDAAKAAENAFSSIDIEAKNHAQTALIRLYDQNFVLCKRTDKQGLP